MTELVFNRQQAIEAIELAKQNGEDWLYQNYPKPGGQMRKSTTGFLMFEGHPYPVKPLGRLANAIAGQLMVSNPITNVFRRYFENLNFILIENLEEEGELAENRQKRLAETWSRPNQAKFRKGVFDLFGARCVVTGCETLTALEAAHVVPVSEGGTDDAWNGIPLRADIHRLFDINAITIQSDTLEVGVAQSISSDYGQYRGTKLPKIRSITDGYADKFVQALVKRRQLAE